MCSPVISLRDGVLMNPCFAIMIAVNRTPYTTAFAAISCKMGYRRVMEVQIRHAFFVPLKQSERQGYPLKFHAGYSTAPLHVQTTIVKVIRLSGSGASNRLKTGIGAPERIRTSDLPLRRRLLYPTELPGQGQTEP